jgi:hypothetical protein
VNRELLTVYCKYKTIFAMNHESQNEMLSAYLDGELTADQRAQVEQLLERKPAARKLLEELRSLSATLKSLPRHKVGEDLSEIVLRTAELRMLTEPADTEKTGTDTSTEPKNEEEQKMGTGASTELVREGKMEPIPASGFGKS